MISGTCAYVFIILVCFVLPFILAEMVGMHFEGKVQPRSWDDIYK